MAQQLLDDDEPESFHVEHAEGGSDFLLVCDHGGNRIPRRLEQLGMGETELATHIAWDLGITETTRMLGDILDALVITQRYSRLVIDCNRWPGSESSIVATSEGTTIAGNTDLTAAHAEQRRCAIFVPYHDRIKEALDQRAADGRRTILVAMHSFTPVFMGEPRQWHVGVLYDKDARFAHAVHSELCRDPALVVGDNEPYAATEDTDYAVIVHAEQRGLLYVELEVRQDLIAVERTQRSWATRIAAVVTAAQRRVSRA